MLLILGREMNRCFLCPLCRCHHGKDNSISILYLQVKSGYATLYRMAYETTDVPVVKSQQKIREMIMKHGGFGIAFISDRDPEGKFPSSEGFHAKVIIDAKPYTVKVMAKVKKVRNLEQEERRIWRVLFHHMKSVFESADSGVMEFRELMLPYMVNQEGRTIAELREQFRDGTLDYEREDA